jgi:uncharacterized protein with PQ loop repeat
VIEQLGVISQLFFVLATVSQAIKVCKDGHADGLSHILVWMLNIGFGVMIYYTIEVLNADPVLLYGYIGQFVGFVYITYMKYFPRSKIM